MRPDNRDGVEADQRIDLGLHRGTFFVACRRGRVFQPLCESIRVGGGAVHCLAERGVAMFLSTVPIPSIHIGRIERLTPDNACRPLRHMGEFMRQQLAPGVGMGCVPALAESDG
jgi:hypothetical protein